MTGQWMTYDELAKAFGISRESARQKAARGHWRRDKGNDGRARVLVPEELLARDEAGVLPGHEPGHDTSSDPSHDTGRDTGQATATAVAIIALASTITRLEDDLRRAREEAAELPALRGALVAAQSALSAAEAQTTQVEQAAQAAADRAEAELANARVNADRVTGELVAVVKQLADAERERQERARRPWWRRLAG